MRDVQRRWSEVLALGSWLIFWTFAGVAVFYRLAADGWGDRVLCFVWLWIWAYAEAYPAVAIAWALIGRDSDEQVGPPPVATDRAVLTAIASNGREAMLAFRFRRPIASPRPLARTAAADVRADPQAESPQPLSGTATTELEWWAQRVTFALIGAMLLAFVALAIFSPPRHSPPGETPADDGPAAPVPHPGS